MQRTCIRTGMTTALLIVTLVLSSNLLAQVRPPQPRWWFGGAIGANFNYYSSELRKLNTSVTAPGSFGGGSGTGLFLSPLLEYRATPMWGGMLLLGFDGRGGTFDDISVGGTTYGLSTSMNYLSLEPSVRVTPFESDLYFHAGPRIGFNVAKSFSYTTRGAGEATGDWSDVRGGVIGLQFGAGYDFYVTPAPATTRIAIAPQLTIHVGAGPRSEESWTLNTIRIGVAVKVASTEEEMRATERDIQFSIRTPAIIPTERKVNETFPMRNYIFFDVGSTRIPGRYIQLGREQAAAFMEENLLEPQPKDLTGRSRRQLTVYHNVLNVLGDRMRKYTQSTVTLVGSAGEGESEGRTIAESVKRYLTDIFGIDGGRIDIEGKVRPEIPSYQPGGTREVDLVKAEDRRVEVKTAAPQLLDPVQIISLQEDPFDTDVQFTVANAEELLASWSVEVSDETGILRRFGPFISGQERVSGRSIIGDKLQGTYRVTLLAVTKSGQTTRKEETMRLVRSDQPEESPGLRFSILFEFDQSKTVATYDRFLSTAVAPLIPDGGSVIIHGHTDVVGEESHNLTLSRDRSRETMHVLERELSRAGKKRVRFDTYGFGEDARRAPFENVLPEERFYNRTVIIDIVPE